MYARKYSLCLGLGQSWVAFTSANRNYDHGEPNEFLVQHLNPFTPNEVPHRYQLEQSISVLRYAGWYFFIFIQILIEHSANKQWMP